MKKIIAAFLSMIILAGPMQAMQEDSPATFKLGIQAANAFTLDESNVHSAKKKYAKKSKKTKKKATKKDEEKSSDPVKD